MNRWPSVFRFGQEAGAEDTEKQSTVKKSSHLTESSKTTTTTTTTSSQQTFRPVNLVNIPLPTTGGHVTGNRPSNPLRWPPGQKRYSFVGLDCRRRGDQGLIPVG
uniref:Uncharacterized protein n=1 Tax=Timema bartmani TaxID=61472 RepID=A0A7R9ETP9_9NEOP|nr:unnamed protein product [Timema bartmani]